MTAAHTAQSICGLVPANYEAAVAQVSRGAFDEATARKYAAQIETARQGAKAATETMIADRTILCAAYNGLLTLPPAQDDAAIAEVLKVTTILIPWLEGKHGRARAEAQMWSAAVLVTSARALIFKHLVAPASERRDGDEYLEMMVTLGIECHRQAVHERLLADAALRAFAVSRDALKQRGISV